ncbi:MAG: TlpA family protein disulfide reductase, partial [Alphaproteobacteria bacterium]|nr:TlpA family protein disulfide reductase [Alphaproteobacteria bacterium]
MVPAADSDERFVELADSPYAIYEHFYASGWTDGLPIIPPTEDLVRATLRFTDRAPEDIIAELPPKGGRATVEKIAVSAVMAGCRPEYLPVLIAAVEAVAEPRYNLYGRQTTTHPGAHLIVINGPIRDELDVNCGQNVLGQGFRANATIGRALRLLLINVGGGIPAVTDMATHGPPGKYSYCIGEDGAGSPWTPLHAERGR